jgi:hypothetical protein
VSNNLIITGFAGGSIVFYNMETKTSRRVETGFSTLRKFTACATGLFGIGKESALFLILSEISICPVPVVDYKLIDDSMLLVKCGDGFVRFMKISEWTLVPTSFQYLPIHTEAELLAKYVQKRRRPYFHPQARDIWLSLLDPQNLRLQAKTGSGARGLFERINADVLSRVNDYTAKLNRLKFAALLFADRFGDAADLLFLDDPTSRAFIETTLFSTILFQASQGCSEKVHAVLKSAGIALFEANQFDLGALLFRVGKLDKLAVEYLIGYGQDELAMRFVRACLSDEEKTKFVFIFGCRRMEQQRFMESMPFFAAAGEFHPVLALFVQFGMAMDAYYLLRFLRERDALREVPEHLARHLPEVLPPLKELCETIEAHFRATLRQLELTEAQVRMDWDEV